MSSLISSISDSVGPEFGGASPAGWARVRFGEFRGQAEPGEELGFSPRGTREPWESCEQVCDVVHHGSGFGLTSPGFTFSHGCSWDGLLWSPLGWMWSLILPSQSLWSVDTGTKACSQPAQLPATRGAERRTGGGGPSTALQVQTVPVSPSPPGMCANERPLCLPQHER